MGRSTALHTRNPKTDLGLDVLENKPWLLLQPQGATSKQPKTNDGKKNV